MTAACHAKKSNALKIRQAGSKFQFFLEIGILKVINTTINTTLPTTKFFHNLTNINAYYLYVITQQYLRKCNTIAMILYFTFVQSIAGGMGKELLIHSW